MKSARHPGYEIEKQDANNFWMIHESGIYAIWMIGGPAGWSGELCTKQCRRSSGDTRADFEPCYRNPFEGTAEECKAEVERRLRAIQARKAA